MKKFIAIAVAALMLLSVIPFTAFAAEGDPIKIVDAEGNDVATYATLQDAFNAVTNTQKIVVMEDIELASWLQYKSTYDKENLRTVVIEGAEKADDTKVKITCAKGLTDQVGLYNLTVRNLEIVNTATEKYDVFMYDPYCGGWVSDFSSPTLTIDNCAVSSGYGVFKFAAQPTSNLIEHSPFIVNIKDSTVTAKGGSDRGIGYTLWNQAASVDMNIVNSTLKLDGGRSASNNPELSYLFTHQAGIAAATFDLSVDGTSKLIANVTNTDNATAGIYYGHSGSSIVTLAQGAELYVDSGENKTSNYFVWSRSSSPLTFTDNGAIYKASATTVKNGIALPTFIENGYEHTWFVGETAVTSPYKNEAATADTVLTHRSSDPALNPNNVAYIEDAEGNKTYYTSVKDALAQAPSGSTIELMKDSSFAGHGSFTSKSLTVDGNGYYLHSTSGYTFDVCGSANNTFTVKNLKSNGGRFIYNEFSTVNVENCEINNNFGLMFSISLPDGADCVVNIKDSTLNLNTTSNEPFAKSGGGTAKNCDITFNLVNSDIFATTANAGTDGDASKACFNMLTGGMFTMKMDATSSVTIAGENMKSIFHGHDATGGITLDLAEGAVIAINNCVAGGSVITSNMNSKLTIAGVVPEITIGAEAAKKGVTLPVIKDAGGKALTWSINGVAVDSAPYTNSKATEAVTLKAIADAKLPFAMINGAGLKTEGEGLGISFGISIDQSIIDRVGPEATYGIRIAPSEYAQFGFDAINEGQYVDVHTTVAGIVEGKCILGITGFPADDSVFLKLTVIGYASYYDSETSKTVTYYTPNTVEISLYELALIAAENGHADNANVKTILAQLY